MIFLVLEKMQVVLKKTKTFWMTGYKGNKNALIPLSLLLVLKKVIKKYGKIKVTKIKVVIIKKRDG